MPVRYQTIGVDGLDVFYREAGDPARPAVLLLHGFPTSSHMFRDLIPELAADYHVVAPDLRGHGESDWMTGGSYSLPDYIYDLSRVVRDIGPPVTLIGHSLGGLVVQRCLGRLPLAGAVLVASLPPAGLAPVIWHVASSDPLFYQQIVMIQSVWEGLTPFAASAGSVVKRMLFAPETPATLVERYMPRWQAIQQWPQARDKLLHMQASNNRTGSERKSGDRDATGDNNVALWGNVGITGKLPGNGSWILGFGTGHEPDQGGFSAATLGKGYDLDLYSTYFELTYGKFGVLAEYLSDHRGLRVQQASPLRPRSAFHTCRL